jgi:glycosyltransferase involved in cell wall biosynthesis
MLLSFIIPLYNCEALVGRCLDSIFSADIDTNLFEVVIVDDGSRDHSVEVARSYAKKHPNISLICQQNAGASAARNAGLRKAQGRYIWFVDADDHIMPVFFGKVIRRLSDAEAPDVFCFNYQEVLSEGVLDRQLFDKEETMSGVEYFHCFGNTYLWNKLIRHDKLRHEFLNGTKNLEDLYFCLQNILPCKRIEALRDCGYYYDHTNPTSTSLNKSKENLQKLSDDTLTIQRHILDDIPSLPVDCQEECKEIVTQTVAGHLYSLLCFYPVRRMQEVIKIYRERGLYPIRRRTRNKRMNHFITLANCQPLLLAACWLKNIFRRQ